MKTFLINLDSATERLHFAQLQFDKIGLAFERISAIRGANLSVNEKANLYSAQRNKNEYFHALSDGEIGCYASHIAAWRRASDLGLDRCLVLEDDLEIDERILQVLEAIENLPPKWDIVRLNSRADEIPLSSQPLTKTVQLIRFRRVPSRTTGYVISRSGIQKMLSRSIPFFRPIDIDFRYFWQYQLDTFGVKPAIIRESALSLQSTIVRPEKSKSPKWQMRLRKISAQLKYSLGNLRHRSKKLPN